MKSKKKLVIQYTDGSFYAWRGESCREAVVHKVKSIEDADDLSWMGFPYQTSAPEYDGRKFIWYTMNYEYVESGEYVGGELTEKDLS